MKKLFIVIIYLLLNFSSFAFPNIQKPVKWNYQLNFLKSDQVELIIIGSILKDWHVYGQNIPDNMPLPISINIPETKNFKLLDKYLFLSKSKIIYDSILEKKLEIFEKELKFKQNILILNNKIPINLKVYITYMACNKTSCTPPIEDSLLIEIKSENINSYNQNTSILNTPDSSFITKNNFDNKQIQTIETNNNDKINVYKKNKSIENFLLALLAGLGALLTPCVYPMIPLTISYFLRKNKNRKQAIFEALTFGFSIIFIYSAIGLLVALIRNPNAIYILTTHWIPNLIFAIVFILFAFSFFGYFEITIPSSITYKIDRKADKGGIAGSFFMALAMTLLSFSCTGPFVATLLIKASQGNLLDPFIGMLGFGLSFSIPFTLLALFPSYINKLPKSGTWLNFIKISIAFLLIGSSVYFLNKINQSYHLKADLLINSFLIGTLFLYFLYLIGKLPIPHDNRLQNISYVRLILAFATLTLAIYLFLKNIPSKQSIINSNPISSISDKCNNPSYSEFLKLPYNLKGYFDYDEALICTKDKNKPILIDFVGHSCSNCKKMYKKVWSDPSVQELLKQFTIVALYVDDKTLLPENQWYKSPLDGKLKKTLGQKNADIQLRKFNTNALPSYFIIDNDENILSEGFYYTTNIDEFKQFLIKGLTIFKEKHQNAIN